MSSPVHRYERAFRTVWPGFMGALVFCVFAALGMSASAKSPSTPTTSRIAPLALAAVVIGLALGRTLSAKPGQRSPSAMALGVLACGWLVLQRNWFVTGSWGWHGPPSSVALWWAGLSLFAVGVGLSVRVSLRVSEQPRP